MELVIGFIILIILVFCIGFHLGMSRYSKPRKDDGVIFVDMTDPKRPYLSLGVSEDDLAKIVKKNTVQFMVVHVGDDSHN